jgi:hypothetical protein
MLSAFAVSTVVAITMLLVDPTRTAGTLTPILLLQLFACSSGFDVPARRGHFDLLLTRGVPRRLVVLGHWWASALPGLVSWLVMATVAEVAAWNGVLFSVGTTGAVLLVSTIPWAVTTRLPRFSGAIGWLLILATVSLLAPPVAGIEVRGAGESWQTWLTTSFAFLVYPPVLVGHALSGRDALVLLPAAIGAGLTMAAAVWSIGRRDIPLEAAQ